MSDKKFEYVGNNIPLFIKIVWILLILWGVGYLINYSWPDLKMWLNLSKAQ